VIITSAVNERTASAGTWQTV